MTEPIKAKCCQPAQEFIRWSDSGDQWLIRCGMMIKMAHNMGSASAFEPWLGDYSIKKPECPFCGSELKKPLPEVVLTEEEWEIFKSIDIQLSREGRVRPYESWPDERSHKAIRSLLSRSRKAE